MLGDWDDRKMTGTWILVLVEDSLKHRVIWNVTGRFYMSEKEQVQKI